MLIKRRPQKWVECPVLMMFEETKQSRKLDRNTDTRQRSFSRKRFFFCFDRQTRRQANGQWAWWKIFQKILPKILLNILRNFGN